MANIKFNASEDSTPFFKSNKADGCNQYPSSKQERRTVYVVTVPTSNNSGDYDHDNNSVIIRQVKEESLKDDTISGISNENKVELI